MIFTSLRKSRGYGKFTRNRWAMVSLSIISVYFAVAALIIGAEAVQWMGTDAAVWVKRQLASKAELAKPDSTANKPVWNLRHVPLVNLMLAESVSERVGPKWLAGFGLKQDVVRRTDQADFIYELVSQAAIKLQIAMEANPAKTEAELREVVTAEQFRLAERTIANVPAQRLLDLHAKAKTLFSELDSGKKQAGLLTKLDQQVATVRTQAAALASAKDAAAARDDLSHAIDEVAFGLEDFVKAAGTNHPLSAINRKPLEDLSTAAADPKSGPDVLSGLEPYLKTLTDALAIARTSASAPSEGTVVQIEQVVAELMPMPTGLDGFVYKAKLLWGTDKQGRSILVRAVYSAKIAIQVGLVVAIASVLFGALMGAAAGYFGSWVDHAVTWLYSTLSSLPQLVLLAVISFMFLGSRLEGTLIPVYIALTLTFWIGTARVVRGEVLKIKELEYVQAGKAIGFSRVYILLRHVLPNTTHILFINFSLLFIGAIKTEVVLTFLGLGIKDGASWGRMITDSGDEVINTFFWQIGAATVLMLILVLAFNVLSDALQDAFDPKHVG